MQQLFASDRSDPFLSLHLTLPQLKILILLSHSGSASGRELSGTVGVSLATMTGIVDRLVAQDLVVRGEDPRDRRVRRVELSPSGHKLMEGILNAGNTRMQSLLSRLSVDELATVERATALLVAAAAAEQLDAAPSTPDPAATPYDDPTEPGTTASTDPPNANQ
ncbi:MarR family winged helix-turn-helix transcriptional regulator [Micromonospora sp. NBC_01796]|uniref:MarR family winged helix-turn-helix transcriptional regulator n=1 Tax=Micromonospora sp. NBC_01796 TaxID=2975987 RepID=UPI002DDBC3DE|nr:MarR family transcriptional regulator [Micromonospora sp. NBC_01796]WSA89534.1 MarR family transcriptional regulator [Micromonospora sp. NBC_01796]